MNVTRHASPRWWFHGGVLIALFIGGYAWMTRGTASPLIGQPAPSVSLSVAAGAGPEAPKRVNLSEMGRVVVLEFWASWCGACERTAPILNALNEEFSEDGVAFYAVNVEPIDRQRLQAAHLAFGADFPTLQDRTGEVQRRYLVRMLPTIMVIDREGLIRWASTGVPSKMRLRAAIAEALN